MRVPVANSHGSLQEFNPYHDARGRFSTGRGGTTTRVGITSARPGTANREVFGHMREFEAALSKLPGVRNVRVRPGQGAWEGGSEPTWAVSYKGNGAARRYLAETAKRFNQDAVLLMKGCRGRDCDPAVELKFDRGVGLKERNAIHSLLVAHGMGGWTWLKQGGKTTLRMVSVPAWGGDRTKHLTATRAISTALASKGYGHGLSVKAVRAQVIERSAYDGVIRGQE